MAFEIPQKVAEKLQKILTLGNDKGATEGEVFAAMAKAREMLQQFNLSIEDFEDSLGGTTSADEEVVEESIISTPQRITWLMFILTAIADLTNTNFFYTQPRPDEKLNKMVTHYIFVGQKTDVATAAALSNFMYAAGKGFADVYTEHYCDNLDTSGKRKYRTNFYMGFATRIQEVVRKIKAQEKEKVLDEKKQLLLKNPMTMLHNEVPSTALAIRWNSTIEKKQTKVNSFIEDRKSKLKLKKSQAYGPVTDREHSGYKHGQDTADELMKHRPKNLIEG